MSGYRLYRRGRPEVVILDGLVTLLGIDGNPRGNVRS
jgi:hypothetical protein